MRCERIVCGDDPALLARELRRMVPAPESVSEVVAEIIRQVRERGDEAVRSYTRLLDTGGVEPSALRIGDAAIRGATDRLDPTIRSGLELAIDNVQRVAEATLSEDRSVDFSGHRVAVREVPVEHAAIYVPGGRAPYPSTVVMGVVTARVAGVEDVVVTTPPSRGGGVDDVVLGTCGLAGATTVYAMGGAQAVAALAYGTDSVGGVDVIVGPGNLYVQEAKRQVFGQVGIDGFAGPSDLLAIADQSADPEPLALDLLAQTEHGDGTLVLGVSSSAQLLDRLEERIRAAPETGAVAALVGVASAQQALALAQAFAPEHLQLVGPGAEELALADTRAGCVFVGPGSASAFGDYIAGSNHILPTGGAARFASLLTPSSFRRRYGEVRIDGGAGALARAAAPVARAEGFELHARSMEARIRDNGQQ